MTVLVPEICRFYGIVIRMYYAEHPPPHFHAEYGEQEALIAIEGPRIIAGELSTRAFGMVREWVLLHRSELLALWDVARESGPLVRIDPLP